MTSNVRKTLMLSIFAFPGAGHFFLKENLRAVLFVLSFALGAGVIIVNIMQKSQAVADKIAAGEMVLDVVKVTQAILAQPDMFSAHTLTVIAWGLLIIWQLSIFDSYRLAKAKFDN